MTAFAQPSDLFPTAPTLSLSAGDGWIPAYPPGAALALTGPHEEGRFAPNVLATVTRFAGGYDLAVAAAALEGELAALADVEVTATEHGRLGAHAAFVREVVFTEPTAGTLVQYNVLIVVESGPVVDLVHVVATAAGDRLDTDYAAARGVAQSLVVA